ncbi:hypothetical protein DPMN_190906 [Dreissena polymorpha]|uniref:Uncharacterized protein n=1 Tax=Dreissena polymorpha TaxID=45954 RepID=A0A9D4BE30_DREPO|nr:hypothetical protein DPMN_190906 [Dreissena polymorpha]
MASSTDCCSVRVHNSPLEILFGQRTLKIFPRQMLMKTCIFFMLYGVVSGSPVLCPKNEYLLHDGIEELNLGVHANFAGSPDVPHLMEGCSSYIYADSDICIMSYLVVRNAAEIGAAVKLPKRFALDCSRCVVGGFGLEHLALFSVDGEAHSG